MRCFETKWGRTLATDDGRDMANRRTSLERAGWGGGLTTRRHPRAGTRGEYREWLRLAESSIVSVGWSLPEPSEGLRWVCDMLNSF